MTNRHMSPKERLFYDELESLVLSGEDRFDVKYFAALSYKNIESDWPPFWRQATMATLNRVIAKLSPALDGFTIAKEHKHGRGHHAVYRIVKTDKPQQL